MITFGFYIKTDKSQEIIDITQSTSELQAAKYFAKRKDLDLDDFLKIFNIKKA